eukprot:CAMPEP_0206137832 /NCGR_PEP_ID=MMETSP1473-20131121/2876_1 /ASSEMBLY_ACC=CAM_ASM_001109 /TAXON_ID=1461547 /ORGANISM="Stichococcus sp, Strain RCC1054" /LENGTH=325 /DNA_ID=CAMNT_0053531083 /DNA_START=126 /DNA_END=1103 /DNA_ORIENTATION=+
MARGNVLFIAALLAVSFGCATARPEPAVNAGHWAEASDIVSTDYSYASLAARGLGHEHHHGEEGHFTLLTKFIVRPSISKEFVGAWLKYREVAKEAEGANMVSLSKPLTDNVLFYGYEQWESKADFFKFMKEGKDEAKDLIKYIEGKDIPVVITQLVRASPHHHKHDHDHHKHASLKQNSAESTPLNIISALLNDAVESVEDLMLSKEQSTAAKVASFHKEDERKDKAIILTKFLVKPSEIVEFIEVFNKVTEAVEKHEKGNVVYGLSKPLDDDVTFYAYAVWEDKEAVKEHLEAEYVKCFGKYILENNIYLKTTLLIPIEKLDE